MTAARLVALSLILTSILCAQTNRASDKKHVEVKLQEPATVVVEEQKISAANAAEKTDDNRPHWYTALKRPEWWLFIAALLTLGAIIYQSRESAKATKAMRDGIELQMESLRPRLVIGPQTSPFMEMIQGKKITVDIEFINTGEIPAYRAQPETWLEFLDIPFTAFTPSAVHQAGGTVTVHSKQPSPFRIPFGRSLTPSEISLLKAVKATLYLRVRLTYEAFGKPKYADCTFQITPTTMNIEHSDSN